MHYPYRAEVEEQWMIIMESRNPVEYICVFEIQTSQSEDTLFNGTHSIDH